MDGNFKLIEELIEQAKELEDHIAFIQDSLREYEAIGIDDDIREVYEILYREEFEMVMDLSSLQARIERHIAELDNVFAQNRFTKELNKMKKASA